MELKYKPNQNVFLTAFLIVLVIVIIIFFGIIAFSNYKRAALEDDMKIINQQLILDDLYDNYLEHTNNKNPEERCTILEKQLATEYKLNGELLNRLRLINKDAVVSTDNYTKLMFVLTNIKLWMNYRNLNRDCNYNKKIILYFYTEEKIGDTQNIRKDVENNLFENRLSAFYERCPNSVAFALPYVTDVLILNQLINDNKVQDSPAIVVDEKVIYQIDELDNISCN